VLYRQDIPGDNKRKFYQFIEDWKVKVGITDVSSFTTTENAEKHISCFKALLDGEKFGSFTVNGKDFYSAVKVVDAINKGEKTHNIALSIHNGYLNLASFPNNDEFAVYEEVCKVAGIDGAIMIDKKYLDGMKTKENLQFAYSRHDESMILYLKGAIDSICKVEDIDRNQFLAVMEYEYQEPEELKSIEPLYAPPTLKEVMEATQEASSAYIDHKKELSEYFDSIRKEKHIKRTPRKRAPRILTERKENGAFTGGKYNRLETKQVKVLNF
jgi:hypothetical protein